MSVTIRKVAFIPQYGVLLAVENGQMVWSKKDKVKPGATAPTFVTMEELDKYLDENGVGTGTVKIEAKQAADANLPVMGSMHPFQLVQVFPSDGTSASPADCEDAGLPSW